MRNELVALLDLQEWECDAPIVSLHGHVSGIVSDIFKLLILPLHLAACYEETDRLEALDWPDLDVF